jgi:hypothetical protein
MRWFDVSTDPNSDQVMQLRQEALDHAWQPMPPKSRFEYIDKQCRD